MRAVTGLLDRWARREQRRIEWENEARPRGGPITWRGAALTLVCVALMLALPWPIWLAITSLALIAGPGRRWFVRTRDARRADAASA
jgi:hypothetical protein